MNRRELVNKVAKKVGFVQEDVDIMLRGTLEVIMEEVADGEEVLLTNFGTIKSVERKAKTARNPKTGEAVQVKAKRVPVFKASNTFKNKVAETDLY